MAVAVSVRNVKKTYHGSPSIDALKNISFDIHHNEFFTLLGPSGCGKTTLLRLIAGFEDLTAGKLHLFEQNISHLPPEKRPVNTVFQHYALFPHMTIIENVAFGLRRLGKTENEANTAAEKMLELVHLDDFATRMPKQLSGGQQQRVALARALAPQPKVLLLDEPLSALDLKLRQNMRLELKRLQRETGITFVFVTHDQEEALAMSDRIAVMSAGKVQQIAKPDEIYETPANRFVADFIGDANFYDASIVKSENDVTTYQIGNGVHLKGPLRPNMPDNAKVTLFVRPEKISIINFSTLELVSGEIKDIVYLGSSTDYQIELNSSLSIVVRNENQQNGLAIAKPGDKVSLRIDPTSIRILESENS